MKMQYNGKGNREVGNDSVGTGTTKNKYKRVHVEAVVSGERTYIMFTE